MVMFSPYDSVISLWFCLLLIVLSSPYLVIYAADKSFAFLNPLSKPVLSSSRQNTDINVCISQYSQDTHLKVRKRLTNILLQICNSPKIPQSKKTAYRHSPIGRKQFSDTYLKPRK